MWWIATVVWYFATQAFHCVFGMLAIFIHYRLNCCRFSHLSNHLTHPRKSLFLQIILHWHILCKSCGQDRSLRDPNLNDPDFEENTYKEARHDKQPNQKADGSERKAVEMQSCAHRNSTGKQDVPVLLSMRHLSIRSDA
jgi:hypothetical protein